MTPQPLIVDNFAGGGGASTGLERAFGRPVDVAVNHDEAAIAIHAANHPDTKHYCQSIFSIDPLEATGGAPVLLAWFSPDCKHHSKAKGGKPLDRNIRAMADVVPHWIERLQRKTPDGEGAPLVIMLENVEEFQDWGPLDEDGRPIKDQKGALFLPWVRKIRRLGYRVQWRELRACDFGAPTSRKRLFLIARRDGRPIVWPQPTHGHPDSVEVRTGKLLPWRTAGECIDWSIECPSIFDRKKLPEDATCRRIASGVMRQVVQADRPYIVGHANDNDGAVAASGIIPLTHHGSPHRVYPLPEPLPTVTGAHRGEMALSAASLIKLRNNCSDAPVTAPLDVISAGGLHHGLVAAFMAQHNAGNGCAPRSMAEPLSTITGRGTQQQPVEVTMVEADALAPELMDRAVMVAAFLIKYYGTDDGGHSLADPLGTVTTKDRFAVVTVTIDAATYIIVDIGMRMLTPRELANAQGFPPDYILDPECWYVTEKKKARKFGRLPKTHQVAKVGNSVCPVMSEALARANLPEHCTQLAMAA